MPIESNASVHGIYLGAASQIITPEIGSELSGFIARVEPMRGVHDDLMAKALVWAEDASLSHAAALVTLDLIELDADAVASIRMQADALTGIPGGRIGITCTHTHGGPATMPDRRLGNVGSGYLERVTASVAETIAVAARSLEPVVL